MKVSQSMLVDQMKEKYGYTKVSSNEFLNNLKEIITENLESGNDVQFVGFCTFGIKTLGSRTSIHPITREKYITEPHPVPKLIPGKMIKDAVKIYADNKKRGI